MMVKKLGEKVDEYALALSAVTRELQTLQSRCAGLPVVPVSSTSTSG